MKTSQSGKSLIPNSSERLAPEAILGLFFIFSFLVGVVLSCVLEGLIIRGEFLRWESVAKVPENTKEVIGGRPIQAYVRTIENRIMSCRLNARDECWIPDVYDDPFYTKACDEQHIAFSPVRKPPQNISSCIEIDTGGGGYHFDVIYVIDRDGNLWQWANIREGGDESLIVLMMVAGGLGGLLIGSILWIFIRLTQIKRSSPENPLFTKVQIGILAIPWLCILFFLAVRFLASYAHQSSNPKTDAMQISASSTVMAHETEVAKRFLIQITPEVGSIKYSFSDHSCDAKWTSDETDISCHDGPGSPISDVRTQSISSILGKDVAGKAILVPTGSFQYVTGQFPAIKIQEGDHLKATIACLQDTPDCNLTFDVDLWVKDQSRVILGRWSPKGENRIEEIDIDLSKFAGRLVRFSFNASSDDYKSKGNQDIVWIMPRIENSNR